jgi:hypothetical protein
VPLLLLWLAASVALSQDLRATGIAELVIDGIAWRFHAFELATEGEVVSTATWQEATRDGWLSVSALFVERDVERETLDDPAFAILSLRFFVDAASGLAVASADHLPSIEFVPNQATYRPVYEGLPARTVVTVNGFLREGERLRISGTFDAMLGVREGFAEGADATRTLRIRGGFELREVVAAGDGS